MMTLSYKRFCELVPKETLKFVKTVLSYMEDKGRISVDNIYINNSRDVSLFYAFYSYMCSSEENSNLLRLYGYRVKQSSFLHNKISERIEKDLFTDNYEFFTPFDNEAEYTLLTPEDIILHMHNTIHSSNQIKTNDLFSEYNDTTIYHALKKISDDKKSVLKQECESSIIMNTNKDLIGIFENAAAVYKYMNDNKNIIDKQCSLGKDALLDLSLLVALLIKEPSNEAEKLIVDFCNNYGLTIDVIRKLTNLRFNIDSEYLNDIYMYLSCDYEDIIEEFGDSKVEDLFIHLINDEINNTLVIKKVLSSANLHISDFDELIVQIKELRKKEKLESMERITTGLSQEAAGCLETIASYYQYLLEEYRNDRIDKSVVDDEEDLIALSVLITSYKYNYDLSRMLEYEGITLEKIAELIKNDFINAELTTASNTIIYNFNKYITKGYCPSEKKNIIVWDILGNILHPDVEQSDIISRLFYAAKGEDIGDINARISKNENRTAKNKRNELEEKLFKGLSAEVYNFIPNILSYYYPIMDKTASQHDFDTIVAGSIICSSFDYDPDVKEYFESKGLYHDALLCLIDDEFFTKWPFSAGEAEAIDKHVIKFIYDRDNKDITVYSIIDNAFKLNSSFELDKMLYKMGVNKEDFIDFESKINAFKSEKQRKKLKEKENSLFVKCGSILETIQYTLRMHRYLETKIKGNNLYSDLIENENDIEELSLLISILVNDKGTYIPYFEHNGITLDVVMKLFNLTEEEINGIKDLPLDESLIINYEKYIKTDYMSDELLVKRLLDDSINSSKVIEKITRYTGNQYEYLKEEAINKQMRKLTPEQGLEVLIKEIVPILTSDSVVDVASYGDDLTQHSSLINDAIRNLSSTDSIEHSVSDINELCGEVFEEPKKPKGLMVIFARKKKNQISHKSNAIDEIRENIANNLRILYEELHGYEYIKKYIEAYLLKLSDYLNKLKEYNSLLEEKIETAQNNQDNDEQAYIDYNNYMLLKEIVDNKIASFNTINVLMKQELVKVNRAIVTHFSTINALNTSNSAIIPILASELALNTGTKSESAALSVSKNLLDLLQNVVNQNVLEIRETLAKLTSLGSMDPVCLETINQSVGSYLQTIDKKDELNEINNGGKPILNKKQ